MNMREYRSPDLAAVTAIADAAWRPIRRMARESLGDRLADLLHPEGDAVSKGLELKAQLAGGKYEILVCEHDNQVVGFITFAVHTPIGEICNNAAAPDAPVKGIGQCMYAAVLEKLRAAGCRAVKVSTGLDWAHAPARSAYERAGFRRHLDSVTYYMELDDK